MKKITTLLAVMILGLSVTAVFAQGKGMGNGMGNCMGKIQTELELSDSQIEQIHQINMSYMEKFHQNRKDKDKLVELRKSKISEIDKVLTDKQKEKMSEFKKNHKNKNKKGNCDQCDAIDF